MQISENYGKCEETEILNSVRTKLLSKVFHRTFISNKNEKNSNINE